MIRPFALLLLLLVPTLAWAQNPPPGFITITGSGWTQAGGVATAPAADFSLMRWNTPSGPNQQAAWIIGVAPVTDGETVQVAFRIEDADNRYRCVVRRVAGANNDTAELDKRVAGVWTPLAAPVDLSVDIQPTDRIGVDVTANAITCNYWSVGAGWNEWKTVVTGTAGTSPAISYIGLAARGPVTATQFFGTIEAVGADTTPPTPDPPTWTATPAVAISQTDIELASNPCTDDVGIISYNVERCAGGGCSDWGAPVPSQSPTRLVTGLTAGTLYRFRLKCSDGTNISTTYSAIVEATTFSGVDATPPTVPSIPMVTRTSGVSPTVNNAALSWTASTDVGGSGVASYLIERGDGNCANFAAVDVVGHPTTTYEDTETIALVAGRCYRVRASDLAGNTSSYSSNVLLHPVSGGRIH